MKYLIATILMMTSLTVNAQHRHHGYHRGHSHGHGNWSWVARPSLAAQWYMG